MLASRDFVLSCFEYAADNKDALRKLLKEATVPRVKVAVWHKQAPLGKKITIVGIEGGKTFPPGKTKEFVVTYLGMCEPTLEVTRPNAYVVPAEYKTAIETLRHHGIAVEALKRDAEAAVEVYRINKVTAAEKAFQGHKLVTAEVKVGTDKRRLPSGCVVIRTDQPLGTLVAFLLEPEAEDGLCTWNFFDAGLREGSDYPVLRLHGEVPK